MDCSVSYKFWVLVCVLEDNQLVPECTWCWCWKKQQHRLPFPQFWHSFIKMPRSSCHLCETFDFPLRSHNPQACQELCTLSSFRTVKLITCPQWWPGKGLTRLTGRDLSANFDHDVPALYARTMAREPTQKPDSLERSSHQGAKWDQKQLKISMGHYFPHANLIPSSFSIGALVAVTSLPMLLSVCNDFPVQTRLSKSCGDLSYLTQEEFFFSMPSSWPLENCRLQQYIPWSPVTHS